MHFFSFLYVASPTPPTASHFSNLIIFVINFVRKFLDSSMLDILTNTVKIFELFCGSNPEHLSLSESEAV